VRPSLEQHELVFSKHRIEALTDGIFAVAMTLLVIELKVPEPESIHVPGDVAIAVARLLPTFISWTISFFVLAIFWNSQHRLFHVVRIVDETLAWLTIGYLAFVSLMPFSSALVGRYGAVLFSQVFYSANMVLLASFSLLMARHVFRHPEIQNTTVTAPFYRAVRFRVVGLMVIAAAAVGMTRLVPGAGNTAFMLMWPISVISRRIERE
jgi:uncharacterized membrane protein